MGSTSFMQEAFIGGEVSQSAQGRVSHPLYRMSLNIARNMIPVETGALHRRPGQRHLGRTRRGRPAKIITFDFQDSTPYQMEFTDGFLRFWADGMLATTNDAISTGSISTANPAVVTTGTQTWNAGDVVRLTAPLNPLLQNRTFLIFNLTPNSFTLTDEITGLNVDGSALIQPAAFGGAFRVREIATPYTGTSWQNLRSVQAETTAVLLNGTQPQILTVTKLPVPTAVNNGDAVFALAPSNFLDGPYLKAIAGSWISSSNVSGVTTLTLLFQTYDATVAYDIGAYVQSIGIGYRSLTTANQNNTPASSPTNWKAVNGGDPINSGAGFTSADIGRLMRLFSEPPLWDPTATYVAKNVVAYTDGSGGYGYWTATGAIAAGIQPGTSTSWAPNATGAIWTWGRILSVATSGVATPDSQIGTLTGGGGVASAYDGNAAKSFATGANTSASTTTYPPWTPTPGFPIGTLVQYAGVAYRLDFNVGPAYNFLLPPTLQAGYWTPLGTLSNISFDAYVGAHYAAATAVQSVTITPTSDVGFTNTPQNLIRFNLRAKSTAPASATDGALLGSTGLIGNTLIPISIGSNDQITTWHYIWIEEVVSYNQPLPDDGSHSFTAKLAVAQVQVFAPATANGSAVNLQIVGPALLYTNAIRQWRLGVFGGANGWPKNGTYDNGRLWLAGVVGNRADSSKSNDIFNFAPTAPSGAVADDNAISAVFDAPDVNAILWMHPEQQGIICGTPAGEWLVFAPGQGAMSPTNIDARRVTKIGCANIEPRRTDHTLVLAQKFQREIMEYFADVYSGKFSAPSINERAKHLTVTGVQELAYQQELASIVWARRGDGILLGTTYKRDSLMSSQGPNIAGAHQHSHGGGRTVISMSVGGTLSGNLDALYMVTAGNDGIYHVEIMTKLLDEGFALTDVWQVDDGIAPSSFSISTTPAAGAPYGGVTINGLWAHNGKTVQAWLVGLDCGVNTDANGQPTIVDFVVANGSIFVPFGDGFGNGTGGGLFTQARIQPYADAGLALPGCVGFTFTSDAQIVRPATAPESGTQAGPGFAKLRRAQQFGLQLYGALSGSIQVGVSFDDLLPLPLYQKDGETLYTPQQLFSGITRAPVNASNDFDNMLCWRITRPVPGWVVAAGEFLHTQDI